MVTFKDTYDAYVQLKREGQRASCDKVAQVLYEQGKSDHVLSRQRVRCLLSEKPEGRALIQRVAPVSAIIVEDRKGVLEWLKQHNLETLPVINPKSVGVADVKGAYVYGDLPVSMARMARSVWLVTTPDGQPIVADLPLTELEKAQVELREIKIKVVE